MRRLPIIMLLISPSSNNPYSMTKEVLQDTKTTTNLQHTMDLRKNKITKLKTSKRNIRSLRLKMLPQNLLSSKKTCFHGTQIIISKLQKFKYTLTPKSTKIKPRDIQKMQKFRTLLWHKHDRAIKP